MTKPTRAKPRQITPKPKAKPGPKTKYTNAFVLEFCTVISQSTIGIVRILETHPDWPDRATIFRWLDEHEEFATKYARAKEWQVDHYVEQTVEIADTEADAAKARNMIGVRQWIAEKLRPSKYGNRLDVDHSGQVVVKMTPADAKQA